jgi:hypothetical protein
VNGATFGCRPVGCGLWAMDTHRLNGKIVALILFQVGECL